MADSKTTNEPSAYDEAMAFTRDQHGPLSERENAIAATAARIAYRWALREIISDLENKVRMT